MLASTVGADLQLWNLATGTQIATGYGYSEPIVRVAADPAGQRVATVANDGTARVWDVATGRERRRFVGHGNLVWSSAFSPDGELLLTGGADGVACLWDVARPTAAESIIQLDIAVESVVAMPNGQSLLTSGSDNLLRQWDLRSRRELRQYRGVTASIISGGITCSADGHLVVSGSDDGTIRIWHTDAEALRTLVYASVPNVAEAVRVG